ncbi:MAG: PhnD/SsuA/transferrin family substrate-binding protein [Campylobacterota bacterium]|nr:PhnD/SsuA/transferrin family substrate-binding protein [Campylobacterota bacterium]
MKNIFILLLSIVIGYSDTIRFSSLPMDKSPKLFEQYSYMLRYLEKETGDKFEFIHSRSYRDLINKFKNGKIDIIELGPLPYIKLKEQYKKAEPFLTFNAKDGNPYYRCEFVTTEKDINSLLDVDNSKKVILTRKLSTCGYLMSELMFQDVDNSLNYLDYIYVETHSNVLINLLIKENSVGSVKSTILDKYEHFNFKKLAHSKPIPGFAFIANKENISKEKIKKIQKAILKLNPLTNDKDKEIVSKWSNNTKYGAIITKKDAYDVVTKAIKVVKIPKEDK